MDDLTKRMADLGAPDPARWAASEVEEGIAQQARFLVLRGIWREAIGEWQTEAIRRRPAGARLLDAGAPEADVSSIMRAAAYEAAFTVLARIDEGYDPEAPEDAPGWVLMETDSEGSPTGRDIGGLHESLLELDPTGAEGGDLGR